MSKFPSARHLLLAAVPLIMGILLSIGLNQGWLGGNPSYQVRFDLSWVFGTLGVLLTLSAVLFLFGRTRTQNLLAIHQKSLEQRQTEQTREFLRRLDHELKNPLTVIRLGLLNLQEEPLSDSQKASLARIGHQSDRLRQLVIDLRRLTELETAVIETETVDLADVLQEAISLTTSANEDNRTVSLTLQQTPWPVSKIQGDRELLIIAFSNLIDNSLKYTAVTDQIEIRVNDDGQQITVEVADNGMGIPEAEVTHIFENLYRGEQARGISGSGLGLPLVERIINLHHGEISVRSRNKMGTVFTIRFM
ncbi:MAG: HAMP domain-containing sensor histidine kinase [Chloroflexota bacterium]